MAVCEILAGARTIAFDRAGDGSTRITYTADFKLKEVLRLAEPFLGGTFKTLAPEGARRPRCETRRRTVESRLEGA